MKRFANRKLIGLMVAVVLAGSIALGVWLSPQKPTLPSGAFEAEENLHFVGFSGTLTISNPNGITRFYPAKDDQLFVQVNKFATSRAFLDENDGVTGIKALVKQDGADIRLEIQYETDNVKKLYADLFVFVPPCKNIVLDSIRGGGLWAQDIRADIDARLDDKDQQTNLINVVGSIKLAVTAGQVHINMADKFPLNLTSQSAIVRVNYYGEQPGPASIQGTDGQVTVSIKKSAKAKIISQTSGVFFSSLTPSLWKQGPMVSDGRPVTTLLADSGTEIAVTMDAGEINLTHQLPDLPEKPSYPVLTDEKIPAPPPAQAPITQ